MSTVFGLHRHAPIALAFARVERSPAGIVIASRPNAARHALGGLFIAVSAYFAFAVVLDWPTLGALALWPGGLAAPFFALVGLVVSFAEEVVTIDAAALHARVERRLLGVGWQDDVRLPDSSQVTVHCLVDPTTANGTPGPRPRRYEVHLGELPLPRFTLGDHAAAAAIARELAEVLRYRLVDNSGG